jgi:uncharacterized membrane protein YkvA (DUF1232 family)
MNNQSQLGPLRSLIDHLRLAWRLMRDQRVPIYLKALPILAVAYLIWPIDIVADILPVLGQLDDLAALVVGLEAFIALCPADVVARIRAELRGEIPHEKDTIDGEWRP